MQFKSILYYCLTGILAILLAILSVFFFIQLNTINTTSNENKILEEYITNLQTGSGIIPSLCPDSALSYSKKYNIEFDQFFPLGSIPNGKIKSSNFQGIKHIINLDKYGFRNSNNIWKSKNINTVYFGDSIVFSSSINDGELFTDIINSEQETAANLGCGGNGLYNSLALAEEVLNSYKVDNLVFFINLQNDITKDIVKEANSGLYEKYLNNKEFKSIFQNQEDYEKNIKNFMTKVVKHEKRYNKKTSNIKALINYKNFINFISSLNKKVLNLFTEENIINSKINLIDRHAETQIFTQNWAYFTSFLSGIKRISNKYNTKITFVILPSAYKIKAPEVTIARSPIKYDIAKNNILTHIIKNIYSIKTIENEYKIIENYQFDIIDLTHILIEENKNNIVFNGHFSQEGHRFLAKYLLKNINSNDSNHFNNIILYNSLNVNNYNTHQSFYSDVTTISINNVQYLDWASSVKLFYNKNIFDEFQLAPYFSYAFYNNKCNDILEITNNLISTNADERLALFYNGLCELKNINNNDIKISISKIKKALFLNIEDLAPYLALAISKELKNLKE